MPTDKPKTMAPVMAYAVVDKYGVVSFLSQMLLFRNKNAADAELRRGGLGERIIRVRIEEVQE